MIDPAALGTLIIGLEADRRSEARATTDPAPRRPARRFPKVRRGSALVLVRLARRIDQSPS